MEAPAPGLTTANLIERFTMATHTLTAPAAAGNADQITLMDSIEGLRDCQKSLRLLTLGIVAKGDVIHEDDAAALMHAAYEISDRLKTIELELVDVLRREEQNPNGKALFPGHDPNKLSNCE